jgi:hypothetical protein
MGSFLALTASIAWGLRYKKRTISSAQVNLPVLLVKGNKLFGYCPKGLGYETNYLFNE